MINRIKHLPAVLAGTIALSAADAAAADPFVLCISKSNHKIAARSSCTRSEVRLQTADQLRGPTGTDGALRIYGDGSSGPLNITADTNWTANPPVSSANYYTDVTIAAGATLTVPSGYVFRCSGKFDVSGSVVVEPVPTFAAEGDMVGNPGISAQPPESQHRLSFNGSVNLGGRGGRGLQSKISAASLRPGIVYGGGTSIAEYHSNNGSGGGVLFVLAKGEIVVHPGGTISADGKDGSIGSGGGGGGILVLASATAVNNLGTVSAKGGHGSEPDSAATKGGGGLVTTTGAGGGGGGGVIQFFSPVITTGVNSVKGGVGGDAQYFGSLNSLILTGAGGAGSYGDGGNGGSVEFKGPYVDGGNVGAIQSGPATDGTDGIVIETPVDPTFSI